LYGQISRQRSIEAWKTLRRPFIGICARAQP
jgi:hypothetical protein